MHPTGMSSTGERLQLRFATCDPAAVDPLLLQNLCDMGFEEHASRAALAATSCRNLEVAIDFMMSNPAPSASAAGASAAAAAPAAAAAAPAPVPEKVMSSFDLEAREAHKQREMEVPRARAPQPSAARVHRCPVLSSSTVSVRMRAAGANQEGQGGAETQEGT